MSVCGGGRDDASGQGDSSSVLDLGVGGWGSQPLSWLLVSLREGRGAASVVTPEGGVRTAEVCAGAVLAFGRSECGVCVSA